MPRWPKNYDKAQMRLNIIRHRQKLYKLLDDVDDHILKPKIKLDSSDLEALKMLTQPKVEIKEEILSDDSDINDSDLMNENSDDELISVGSNEEWNGSYKTTTSDEVDMDMRRRSKRVDGQRQLLCHEKKKNDYVYYSDNKINDNGELQRKRKRSWKRPAISDTGDIVIEPIKMRFKAPIDRDLHNAKERACRDHIARMFNTLQRHCSYLDSRRRTPSKMSILMAAKTEVIVLREEEKKLIVEKKNWEEANRSLKKKLKRMALTANTDESPDVSPDEEGPDMSPDEEGPDMSPDEEAPDMSPDEEGPDVSMDL